MVSFDIQYNIDELQYYLLWLIFLPTFSNWIVLLYNVAFDLKL